MCVDNANIRQNKASTCSVQDNTEPLMQFWGGSSPTYAGMDLQKSSFLQAHYKVYNINLAQELEKGSYNFHPTIQKTAKSLTCCSHLAKVAYYPQEDHFHKRSAFIETTSQKCRNKLCARCNSIKSGKYKRRFLKAYVDTSTNHLFKGKYFYFITLGLKHNLKGVRSQVFLDQLKGYMKQLRRSTLWKAYFPYHSTTDKYSKKYVPDRLKSGYAQSYELTITKNGFNIHSHILMCAAPLKGKITKIEQNFRDKWHKITGDSTNVRIDLVKVDATTIRDIKNGKLPTKFSKYISECFKYTVKAGTTRQLEETFEAIDDKGNTVQKSRIDLLSEWMIETKGKRMITSNGFFKGMQLFTTNKSKWDDGTEEIEKIPYDKNARYFVGRTADLKFNYSTKYNYDKDYRRYVLDRIYLKTIPLTFQEITDCGDKFDPYMKLTVNKDWEKFIGSWIAHAKHEHLSSQPLTQEWIDKVTPRILGENRVKEAMFIQESLFEDY